MAVNGTYPLIKPWKETGTKAFVTVAFSSEWPTAQVKVAEADFNYCDYEGKNAELRAQDFDTDVPLEEQISELELAYLKEETEEEAMNRIRRSFEILDKMTEAAQNGDARAIIISGPPGIGKSYGVEEVLHREGMIDKLAGRPERFGIVKGAARALALYKQLYTFKSSDNVLVFDDCDSILFDDESLNLLKAALDTTKRRTVSWLAESNMLRAEDIPPQFEFNGSVIFLTNLDFDNIRSKKLAPHLRALKSRCLYMNLEITSNADMLLRIRQVMRDGLLSGFNFTPEVELELYNFMVENVNDLLELSLRTLLKLAQFRRIDESTWKEYAVTMTMNRNARYRWLTEEKKKRLAAAEAAA